MMPLRTLLSAPLLSSLTAKVRRDRGGVVSGDVGLRDDRLDGLLEYLLRHDGQFAGGVLLACGVLSFLGFVVVG